MVIGSFFLLRVAIVQRRLATLVGTATIGVPRLTRAIPVLPMVSAFIVAASMWIGIVVAVGVRFAQCQTKTIYNKIIYILLAYPVYVIGVMYMG